MRFFILPFLLVQSFCSAGIAADLFESQQWGLENAGDSQVIDLDPMHIYRVPARKGEDVHAAAAVSAKKKILVAVLDTGIQKNHPDLKNAIHRNESECRALEKFLACVAEKDRTTCEKIWMDPKNAEVDQDHNGYPLDCQGWSLMPSSQDRSLNEANIMGRPDFDDNQGHGTHIAGIIAAQGSNGLGIRGVSNNVEILPVQVLDEQPSEPIKPYSIDLSPTEEQRHGMNQTLGDMVARGVIYAINSGAQVISFSMGWPAAQDSKLMREAIAEALRRGIIIVAAAGNDSTRALLRPCSYAGVICVGAAGPDGAPASFSNFGSGVEITAPGVNILSTYPESKRPVRFRSTLGYEFLSGTSQATPFVAGAVAELLARGVPSAEVYGRLILGSRALQPNLNLIENISANNKASENKNVANKFFLAGQLDIQAALAVPPQPLIVPANKEKIDLSWDRKKSNIDLEVTLVNKWQTARSDKIQLQFYFAKPHPEAIRPAVLAVTPKQSYATNWSQNEERTYVIRLQTASRMPGELDLIGQVTLNGSQRRFVIDVDVTVPVGPEMADSDVQVLTIANLPKGRTSFLPIDENLDSQPQGRDYIVSLENLGLRQLWLLRQNKNTYDTVGGTKIDLGEDSDNLREQISVRLDWDNDGTSDYVLGYLHEPSEEEPKASVNFFIFNNEMKLLKNFKFASDKTQIPYQVSWHLSHGKKFPAWVGGGKDPQKKFSLRERWENPQLLEKNESRFYYLEDETTLRAINDYEGYKFVDVLEPRPEQILKGIVPVLLAKNQGTEAKSSFLYSFATAEVIDGKVQNFMELELFGDARAYRNIFEARVDRVFSTETDNRIFSGNYWFGEGILRQQRLSVLDNKHLDVIDSDLKATHEQTDSALWVRAAFSGASRNGAFVLTNSEIQYHDLDHSKVASHSMERYTFYPDMLMTNLFFPLTIGDSQNSGARLPALFTTESSGLSRGVKLLVPVFAKDQKEDSVIEVVSPAKLRFNSAPGCRPMDTPVFVGGTTAHALDYLCKDRILRIPLTY